MIDGCDCRIGMTLQTPLPIANRPGLTSISYRIGTFASFFASMKARLSTPSGPDDPATYLKRLLTREMDDPAIALLDGWAIIAEILTFYQERIANEGYLRTATEQRSVFELGRLT